MGWGQILAYYDPGTEAVRSWNLPPYSGLARLYSMDGRIVALTIDPDGEIWVVASMVSAVFGFNPTTSSWDRTVNLQFVPIMGTKIGAPRTGLLTISGVPLNSGALDPSGTPVFALVMTGSHEVKVLPAHVRDYAMTGTDEIVYADNAGNIAKLSLTDGVSTVVATGAPIGRSPSAHLESDGKGDLWFSLLAYRSVGVAQLNLSTGAIKRFNFPYVIDPGGPGPPNTCPTNAIHCIPDNAVFDPGIQAIVLDQRANVWIVTELNGSGDPNQRSPMTPIMELQTSP